MKRFLFPLLATLALPIAVNANVEPAVHNLCKDVSDYMGCVKANSKKEVWNPFKKTSKKNQLNDYGITDIESALSWCNNELKKINNINYLARKDDICSSYFYKRLNVEKLNLPPTIIDGVKIYRKCSYDICADDPNIALQDSINKWGNNEAPKSNSNDSIFFESFIKDSIYYKGKTYTASRSCPDGEKMRWQTYGFRKKIEELGCMTEKEHEAYWRTAKQRNREKESRAIKEALDGLGKAINPPTIYCDSYGNEYGYNTTCTQY